MSFQNATDRMLDAAVRGMTKAVIALEADTKDLTHVKTGALRRSWTHEVSVDASKIVGSVGSNLEYAKYEDTYHPSLSAAISDNRDKYFQIVADELRGG